MPTRKNKNHREDNNETRANELMSDEEAMNVENVTERDQEQAEKRTPSPGEVQQALQAEEEIQKLKAKVKELEVRVEKEKNEQLYIRAEFDTYRRRAIKERSESIKYAGERTFRELLGVLDNFERALQVLVTPDSIDSFRSGVKLIAEEIRSILKKEGVEEVAPKNDIFDPNIFEAISSEETNEKTPGSITQIFRKAYKLHDRIIRPGQVAVAKPASKKSDDEKSDDDGWEVADEN